MGILQQPNFEPLTFARFTLAKMRLPLSKTDVDHECYVTGKRAILAAALLTISPIVSHPAFAASVPEIDVQRSCRYAATASLQNDAKQAYQSCLNDEEAARKQMVQEWGRFSASSRAACTGEQASSTHSYVELQTCLEMRLGGSFAHGGGSVGAPSTGTPSPGGGSSTPINPLQMTPSPSPGANFPSPQLSTPGQGNGPTSDLSGSAAGAQSSTITTPGGSGTTSAITPGTLTTPGAIGTAPGLTAPALTAAAPSFTAPATGLGARTPGIATTNSTIATWSTSVGSRLPTRSASPPSSGGHSGH
jgi:hypothetical protein